jgi:energy-coupling factor transport system ATP-binding protein
VADDVAFGPLQMGLPRDEVRARVQRAMDLVGLPVEAYGDRLTMGLSGGERRRAALAGVLALEPAVLVLDEPTVGLDPRGRRELLAFLDSWRREEGRAVIWATHSMDEVADLADRVYVLVEGEVTLQGSPREVFSHGTELVSFGLDLPPIRQVLEELFQAGLVPHSDAVTVEEAVMALECLR